MTLTSHPPGAEVFFPNRNQKLSTPCEIDYDVYVDEPVVITKYGYRQFDGTLDDITRVGERTFEIELVPLRSR